MGCTLIGAGAIGGSMAAWLSRAQTEVLYVDVIKEHVHTMNEKGLTIRISPDKDFNVPVRAILLNDLNKIDDIVFLATKSQHTRTAMEKITPLLPQNGYIVSLQNGINEYSIAEYVGRERVVGAFVNWAADYIEPGVIQFGGKGEFMIGELGGEITPRLLNLQRICSAFQPVKLSHNIMQELWSKQINICAMFATGITHLLIPGGLDFEPTQETIACLVLEAMQVPAKLGIFLVPFDDFRPNLYCAGRYHEALKVTADHYRSMLKNYTGLYRDLAVRKRRSEIDGTVGFIVESGQKLGLPLPLCQSFIKIVHEIEANIRPICTENLLELKDHYQKFYPDGLQKLISQVSQ